MNNSEILTKNWKQILIWGILLIGIISAVYMVRTQQIIKSRAASNINDGLRITDDLGQELPIVEENTYQTSADHINVSIRDMQQLITP